MNPDLMMIESDRDLRNPADFLVIDKIAKALKNVHGIAQVQTITRPDGEPIKHSTIPYTLGQNGTTQLMNNDYLQTNLDNILKQANDLQNSIDSMTEMMSIQTDLAAVSQRMADKMKTTSGDIVRRPGPPGGLRRPVPAVAQLPLLGAALLRHSDVLVHAVDLRRTRRHQHRCPTISRTWFPRCSGWPT